jgi:chromate transporter
VRVSDDIVKRRLTAPIGDGSGARLLEIARLFLRLGFTAFGGPAAHVPLMEAEVVTRRAWMTRGEFLDLYGVVQLLPGPNSTELAVHLGHARGGWRGGVVAGLCFVLPAVVMVWALAALSSAASLAPVISAVQRWMTPVIVALLAAALWTFGRQAWNRPRAAVVMPAAALAALALPGGDLVILGLGASCAMVAGSTHRARAATALMLAVGGALAGAAILSAQGYAPPPPPARPGFMAMLLHFLRAGISVFGSGYVLLAWLQRDLVTDLHWMSFPALTYAAALAQITPGPLFTTATAAGYAIAGNPGALAATIGIFAPAFLSVPIGVPVRRLVEHSAVARRALDGVVIASVALLGRVLVAFAASQHGWQWGMLAVAAALLASRRVTGTALLLAAVSLGILAANIHLVR